MPFTRARDSSRSRITLETTTVANMEHRMPMPMVYRCCTETSSSQMFARFHAAVVTRKATAAPKNADVCSLTSLGLDMADLSGSVVPGHRCTREGAAREVSGECDAGNAVI